MVCEIVCLHLCGRLYGCARVPLLVHFANHICNGLQYLLLLLDGGFVIDWFGRGNLIFFPYAGQIGLGASQAQIQIGRNAVYTSFVQEARAWFVLSWWGVVRHKHSLLQQGPLVFSVGPTWHILFEKA